MKKEKLTRKELSEALNQIRQEGIVADSRHLKKDMCAQFSDPDEWIREYVVNAFDANANQCQVWGTENENETSIYVKDNGQGMDKQGLLDFFTIYRSIKKMDKRNAIGKFGIGKMSVAAIPGQIRFLVQTSTGKESWEAEAGSLLAEDPITLTRVKPLTKQGTTFCITFKKEKTLLEVLKRLSSVLKKYTCYLPMETRVHFPETENNDAYEERIVDDWSADNEQYGYTDCFTKNGRNFEIILGLGQTKHEIYQNKVFITNKYNLLAFDMKDSFDLPYLRIRVNSPDFELPFGRHCLSNEEVLKPLSKHLRTKVLPEYFEFLKKYWEAGRLRDPDKELSRLEEMVMDLNINLPLLKSPWSTFPVYKIYDNKKASLADLEQMVSNTGNIYLAESENTGVDYSFFDGPVVTLDQPTKNIDFLKQYFTKEMLNLSLNDVVIESPPALSLTLTQQELNFENGLGIDIQKLLQNQDNSSNSGGIYNKEAHNEDMEIDTKKLPEEIKNASEAFAKLKWKVNYLVGTDGKTPCKTHRFIVKHNTVILNLYHPDVEKLVKLSLRSPELAGHWAVAMCLTEDNSILSHLSSENIEDLLIIDAMSKLASGEGLLSSNSPDEFSSIKESMMEWFSSRDYNFSNN